MAGARMVEGGEARWVVKWWAARMLLLGDGCGVDAGARWSSVMEGDGGASGGAWGRCGC